MDTNNVAQQLQKPDNEAARQLRTRLLVDSGRAALIAYMELVEADVRRALGLLDQLDDYCNGGELPEAARMFTRAATLVYKHESGEPETPEYQAANATLDERFRHRTTMADAIVEVALGHAGRYGERPLDLLIDCVRKAIEASLKDGEGLAEVMLAYETALGYDAERE